MALQICHHFGCGSIFAKHHALDVKLSTLHKVPIGRSVLTFRPTVALIRNTCHILVISGTVGGYGPRLLIDQETPHSAIQEEDYVPNEDPNYM